MEIVDQKSDHRFLDDYVNLRNSYVDLLLTRAINLEGTKACLAGNDVEIRGIIEDHVPKGVNLVNPIREGEVAFFVRIRGVKFGNHPQGGEVVCAQSKSREASG